MRKTLLVLSGVLMAASLWADDLTRAIQQRLKDQGFYYGEVDGQGGDETSAAIRRYQIRYGLKVTGELNDETLHSLGISPNSSVQTAPGYQKNERPYTRQPEDQYYQQPPRQYYGPQPGDQYYQQVPRQYYGQPLPQPESPEEFDEARPRSFPAPPVITSLPRLFAGTIYEQAPTQIQENVLYAVQGELMKRGFFRGIIDGRPGPATSDAIFRLQQEEGLPMTGRLDNETLNDLGAFPGQRNGPPERGFGPAFSGDTRNRIESPDEPGNRTSQGAVRV
jgi:peptidoglycan hydrolase-like protein with peptidoglycan-binding domain